MTSQPLAGIRVVEVALGTSVVGAGMAASLPGALLRDLGAEVARVRSARPSTLDAGVELARAWDHGKEIVEVADHEDPAAAAQVVTALAGDADVLLLTGSERLIEQQGLRQRALRGADPGLVVVRNRPSVDDRGPIADLELLVAARLGIPTQIRSHEPGRPAFPDLTVAQAGAGLSATVGALARLYEREATGIGGWVETSLYDGALAILPMIIGRVEHASPTTNLLWNGQGPGESLCYRCADGGYVQLWFGARGAYEAFLEHMGDEPSEDGYNADLVSGAMVERGARWAERFASEDRQWWLQELAGQQFRCEPAWLPGEALLDDHVREVGLTLDVDDPDLGEITVAGPVVRVAPAAGPPSDPRPTGVDGAAPGRTIYADDESAPLLTDVRVLDLSAFLAGPVMPLVLAELGADVVKVEPLTGDVHRSMEPMFAAGQRGKRAVALDMKSPAAPTALDALFRWSDVVHHNSRLGLAERLGYDEATVRQANPDVVYSFASGFGEQGPRAPLPANDQLMQALSGIEAAQGGDGGAPTFLVWGAVDVTGGWVAACGAIAGLVARRRTGSGQRVSSSLLGAGLLLKSGAFVSGGSVVRGPVLDGEQLGYGAAYRLYRCGDGAWLALAVPDAATWKRLGSLVPGLPPVPPPLRAMGDAPQPAEATLELAFASQPAAAWVTALRGAAVPVEPVADVDRAAFVAAIVDDPVNRQLGRIVSYPWGDRGLVDQPRFPPRTGPTPAPSAGAWIPRLDEHTAEVLAEAGLDAAARAALAEAGAIPAT